MIDKSKINYSMLQHTASVHATQPAIYLCLLSLVFLAPLITVDSVVSKRHSGREVYGCMYCTVVWCWLPARCGIAFYSTRPM